MEQPKTLAGALEEARERVGQRAGQIRAEMDAAMARLDHHDAQLDGHDRRLNAHDEELRALKARVDAMAPALREAYVSEGLAVPEALREEPAGAPLQVVPGAG